MKRFIVTGIGTDVGKTIAAAVLTEYLTATYWKPVQAGDLENSDTMKVQRMCGPDCSVLEERFRLNTPASPHLAAENDGVKIRLSDLALPELHEQENFVVETAGGLMVPINDEGLIYLDVIENWGLPVYLVTKHYLGSINHTLLSLYALQQRKITVAGMIVNGDRHEPSERIYTQHFPELKLLFIPQLETLSQNTIAQCAKQWKQPG